MCTQSEYTDIEREILEHVLSMTVVTPSVRSQIETEPSEPRNSMGSSKGSESS